MGQGWRFDSDCTSGSLPSKGTISSASVAQETAKYQTDFPPEELDARRNRVLDAIGDDAIAIVQGATTAPGFVVFRQSNEFFYLTGLEVPQSYLLLDGRARRALLFLPHRDPRKERGEGKTLSAEDAELVQELTGVDAVYGQPVLHVLADFCFVAGGHGSGVNRWNAHQVLLQGHDLVPKLVDLVE